ncbi:MAG TPA: type II toxin-antitoxin system VapC family toxin [Actinomycetales bacterium]|nr:type II toxin-antitoxin system VapC family toxin [Actinomycetales bacterium]
MIVDASALVAIVRDEPDSDVYARALARSRDARLSAATYVEAAVVVDSAEDPVASRQFDDLLQTSGVTVVAVTSAHAEIAREAYRDYGKGSGHPARLNLGDCFSYALARATGEPLLFKGDDFSHTDLRSALE